MATHGAFNQGVAPLIACINRSSVYSNDDMAKLVPALRKFLDNCFIPIWGTPASLTLSTDDVQGAWSLVMLDDADAADALGYHDLTKDGYPISKVFVKTTLAGGEKISTTACHELAEMLVDPAANLWAQHPKGAMFAYEMCLTGETLVRHCEGETPIGDLVGRGGPRVHAANSQGDIVTAPSSRAYRTKRNQHVVRVMLRDGTYFRCTDNHKVLLSDGTYRTAGKLKAGDVLFSEVGPGGTPTRAVDGGEVGPIEARKFQAAFFAAPNVSHGFFSQFGSLMIFAATANAGHSIFAAGIQHVLAMGSDKKMSWVKAGPNIAGMAHLGFGRDITLMDLIRVAVGRDDLILLSDLPVSGTAYSPGPKPTTIGFSHSRPEAFFEGRSAASISFPSGKGIDTPGAVLPAPMGGAHTFSSKGAGTSGDATFAHAKVIHRVESDGKEDVYDLTVPGLHNFGLGNGTFVHNCDACEEEEFLIDGIAMSDFVTPAYFEGFRAPGSARFDYLKLIKRPFQILHGGYAITSEAGKVNNVFGSQAKREKFAREDRRYHRSEYRKPITDTEIEI